MSLAYGFALKDADTAEEFSNALQAIAGDGITGQGGRFSATVNGMNITLSSGYAMAAGRWLRIDEPYTMSAAPPRNDRDRTDAVCVSVDYEERRTNLKILADVDPVKLREDASQIRNEAGYAILLYFIHIRRGATSLTPKDVTDLREDKGLCGKVVPLSGIAGDVLYIYNFLTGGIDQEVARLIELSNQAAAKADAAIVELNKAIQKAGGGAEIGELMTSRLPPSESGWLLCSGGPVPAEYPQLSAMLGGMLPTLSQAGDRYGVYIFGGAWK